MQVSAAVMKHSRADSITSALTSAETKVRPCGAAILRGGLSLSLVSSSPSTNKGKVEICRKSFFMESTAQKPGRE